MALAEVFVLDVGHGSAAILTTGETCVVIDAGHAPTVLDFLGTLGISEVAALYLSHSDADHISGAQALITTDILSVNQLIINPDSTKETETWRDLLSAIKEQSRATKETPLKVVSAHNRLDRTEFGDVCIEVLAPPIDDALVGPGGRSATGQTLDSNSQSVVLRISAHGRPRVLFAGDVTHDGWRRMVADGISPNADVYIASHHGGRIGGGPDEIAAMLRDVNADTVLVSNGRGPNANPRAEFVTEVLAQGKALMCTQLAAACGDHGNRGSSSIDLTSRGVRSETCCAGTIRLLLHPERTEITGVDLHARFVDEHVPRAMCRGRR